MKHKISFSITAVARLGVPPGKWFCLARTGLGYGQYSCCVCGAHHDAFAKNWNMNRAETDWKKRIEKTVDGTLVDMKYHEPSEERNDRTSDVAVMKERINNLLFTRENYIINPWFADAIRNPTKRDCLLLITDGPTCLAKMLIPELSSDQIISRKSELPTAELAKLSDAHIGTNQSDLRLPQTVLLVNRKLQQGEFPDIKVVGRLTPDLVDDVVEILRE